MWYTVDVCKIWGRDPGHLFKRPGLVRDPACLGVTDLPLSPPRAARPGHGGSDWAPLPMDVVRQYKPGFTDLRPIMCSDFWGDYDIWILSVHFIYLFCICRVYMLRQNGAYCPLRVPFKNRVTKTQPCIRWRPLRRTTLNFIRNLLLGFMLLSLNKKLPLKWDWKKEDSSGMGCCPSFSKSLQ